MTSSLRTYHGIDIGGTKIELASFNEDGLELTEVYRKRIATPTTDFDSFVHAIKALVTTADAVLGVCAPVGIGVPGVVNCDTGHHHSANVPAINGRSVKNAIQDALQRPLAIGNDCQCFALSEAQGGAVRGLPSMFGAVIGTGVAGGFCVDGRLLLGHNGLAGEWGHCALPATMLEQYELPLYACSCGLLGCIERYISGPGLRQIYAHFGGGIAEPRFIVEYAQSGDDIAKKTLAIHVDIVGHALASLVLVLDPHAIVLGGGLSNLAHLYEQLPTAIQRHLFTGVKVPPILPPSFGDAGGARGAALLIKQQLLK